MRSIKNSFLILTIVLVNGIANAQNNIKKKPTQRAISYSLNKTINQKTN